MVGRFIVTHIGDDGETILSDAVAADEVAAIVVRDLMASEALKDRWGDEDREAAFDATVSLSGLATPPFPEEITVYERTYRIEEHPDDRAALNEVAERSAPAPLEAMFQRIGPLPSKLRYEIWPNESQHRGQPHCKVSYGEDSATFSIPEGRILAGSLRPSHETEARRTIRNHADELMRRWQRLRPDDQRL